MSDEAVYTRFAQKLPRRIEVVRRLVLAAEKRRSADDIARAHREAHKLAGTASSFGQTAVGDAVRTIERALEEKPIDWSRLWTLVARMDDAARTAAPGPVVSTSGPEEPARVVDPRSAATRLLIADARPEAAREYDRLLGHQSVEFEVVSCLDGDHRPGEWDAILVDASSGSGDHPFACAEDARRNGSRELPIAVISDDGSLATRVAAAHAGADLFLFRPISAAGLADAVMALRARAQASRPRVLVIDDDEDALEQLGYLLQCDGIEVETLPGPERIIETLGAFGPHAILVDQNMPGFTGAELCAMLRASREYAELPVLFVSACADAGSRRAAYCAGCDDYFLKPVVGEELCARVRARIERAAMRRAAAERDTLTGLPLRRVFLTELEARISESLRRDEPLVVCLIDIDHFKRINDTHGHLAGDHVLAEIGGLLAARFRGEDLRCRWGGEEFALAFPGVQVTTARRVVERVHAELIDQRFESDIGSRFAVSFSAGLSSVGSDGGTAQELIAAADRRLYAAKRAGRARVVSDDAASHRGGRPRTRETADLGHEPR